MEIHALPYGKSIASGHLLRNAGNSELASVTAQRGGKGWGAGGGSEDICTLMANSCSCMAEIKPIL